MSTTIFSASRLVCAVLFLLMLAGVTAHAAEKDLKLEVQLVVGSNDRQTNGTPVSPKIEKRLKRLPLKWGNYYVTSSQKFSLSKNATKPLVMGGSEMVVKNLGNEQVELTLINRAKITQSLSQNKTLVTNVKDENSFVVLRQAD